MSCKKIFIAIILFIMIPLSVKAGFNPADSLKPEIGKPMPDFVLRDVSLFKKKTVSVSDFKGQWLFLDFWSIRCTTCISSFPKVNALHREFKNNLSWMMVGILDYRLCPGTTEFYERMRVKRKLEMPYAFDSLLVRRWDIHTVPHIIVVDPAGIVRYITNGSDINAEQIRDLLAGKKVNFRYKNPNKPVFDPDVYTGGKTIDSSKSLVYRSFLTKWKSEQQGMIGLVKWLKWPEEYLKKGFQLTMAAPENLYMCAFTGWINWTSDDPPQGVYYPRVIFETSDSSG
ncbi:MAG: TlpA disulfide reductase family protein [Bacteroidota bacterium]